jgi:hypothetical protein
MNEQLERQVIQLIAADRIAIPINSMGGKLDRRKPKLAREISLPGNQYQGERVYARFQVDEGRKARGMKDAIAMFSDQYPRYGAILQGLFAEERV